MKIKYFDPDGTDRVVEVPDGVQEVRIELVMREKKSVWPSVVFFLGAMVWSVALVWLFRG